MTEDHPPLYRLEGHAVGESDEATTAHLEACAKCADYVAEARASVAAAAMDDADAFVARLRAATPAKREPRRWSKIAWVGAPVLAAAAALLLYVRAPADVGDHGLSEAPTSPSVRFKGRVQLAIVRDRAGTQDRFTTSLPVRAGDRIRAEIAIDDTKPIVVGVLGDDGSWFVLLAPTLLEAGTQLSEKAVQFDARPGSGWVLAGHPEDVTRARTTRSFDEVAAIPFTVEDE